MKTVKQIISHLDIEYSNANDQMDKVGKPGSDEFNKNWAAQVAKKEFIAILIKYIVEE